MRRERKCWRKAKSKAIEGILTPRRKSNVDSIGDWGVDNAVEAAACPSVRRPPSICPSVSLSVRHPSVCPSDRMGYWDQTTKEQQNVHTFDCRMRKCKRCTYIRVCKCDRRSYFTALSRNLRPLFFFFLPFMWGPTPQSVCANHKTFV